MRFLSFVPNRNLLFITLLFLCLECGVIIPNITDPIDEARYRDDGGRIRRDDAIALVMPSIFNYYTNCNPNYSSTSMFGTLFKVGCDYSIGDENDYKGCADFRYLHRERVELCRIALDSMPCGDSGLSSEFWIAISLCQHAFREAVTAEYYF